MRFKFVAAVAVVAAVLGVAAAQTVPADAATRIPGAWASGENAEACRTGAITYFMSDGTYVVFERADGAFHAVGRWRLDQGNLMLTHTDAPFPENGVVGGETPLTIVRLDGERFVSRNPAGRERVRVRCAGLVLPPGAKTEAH